MSFIRPPKEALVVRPQTSHRPGARSSSARVHGWPGAGPRRFRGTPGRRRQKKTWPPRSEARRWWSVVNSERTSVERRARPSIHLGVGRFRDRKRGRREWGVHNMYRTTQSNKHAARKFFDDGFRYDFFPSQKNILSKRFIIVRNEDFIVSLAHGRMRFSVVASTQYIIY